MNRNAVILQALGLSHFLAPTDPVEEEADELEALSRQAANKLTIEISDALGHGALPFIRILANGKSIGLVHKFSVRFDNGLTPDDLGYFPTVEIEQVHYSPHSEAQALRTKTIFDNIPLVSHSLIDARAPAGVDQELVFTHEILPDDGLAIYDSNHDVVRTWDWERRHWMLASDRAERRIFRVPLSVPYTTSEIPGFSPMFTARDETNQILDDLPPFTRFVLVALQNSPYGPRIGIACSPSPLGGEDGLPWDTVTGPAAPVPHQE